MVLLVVVVVVVVVVGNGVVSGVVIDGISLVVCLWIFLLKKVSSRICRINLPNSTVEFESKCEWT